jgi:putative transposase
VTTRQRRGAVTHLRTAYPVSDRRACRLVHLARSRWQYHPHRPDDGPLAAALAVTAAARPRWGYRRLALRLTRDGWMVNRKRVLRVYREAGLRSRKRRRRKQVSPPRIPRPVAAAANTQWTLDFITDAVTSGRTVRGLSIVDEFTRECLVLRADVSQPSTQGVAALEALASSRAVPQRLILDNGPEFVAKALDAWAYARRVELSFTRPATPVDNCFVESFHDKFRDECLSTHWFRDLPEAQQLIRAWQDDSNTVRPHQGLGNRPRGVRSAPGREHRARVGSHDPSLTDSLDPHRGAGPIRLIA